MKPKSVVLIFGIFVALFFGEVSVRAFRRELFSTSNLIERAIKIKKKPRKGRTTDSELGWGLSQEETHISSQLVPKDSAVRVTVYLK